MTIEDYLNTKKRSKKILDTIKRDHYRAFDIALDTLVGEDGLLDVDKLNEAEYQERFADSMDAYYKTVAKAFFESETNDALKQAMMANTYAGINREGLLQLIKQENTKLFRENKYINFIPELTKQVQEILSSDTLGHIKEEDIDPILEYTNITNIVDRNKVDKIGAIKILNIFDEYREVPKFMVKDYLRED